MPEITTVDGEEAIFYQGPSPDDATLADFAQKRGFEFSDATETSMNIRFYPVSGL